MSSKLALVVFVAAAGLSTGLVLADPPHPQTHHCKLSDGTMDLKKTHKQCTAANGTWFKDVQTPGAGSGSSAGSGSGSGSSAPGAGSGSNKPAGK